MVVMLLIVSTVFTLQSPERLKADDFAQQIDAANVLSSRDYETVFEMRAYPRRQLDDQSPWDPLQWEILEEYRYVALGKKLYLHRTVFKKANDPKQTPISAYAQENRWTDGAWSLRVNDMTNLTLYAQTGATDLFSKGYIFNLMEGRYPTFKTLAELVAEGQPIEEITETNGLSYRFAQNKALASTAQHIIHVSLKPNFEMTGYTTEVTGPGKQGSFADRVKTRAIYSILEWEQFGDLRLPKRARVETTSPKDLDSNEGELWTWRAEYTRKSFREITAKDIDPELFTVSMPIGTKVYDDRIKLSFEIGKKYLSIDGTLYKLNKPVMEHPGDNLAEMVRIAIPQHPPSGSVSPTTEVIESNESSMLSAPIVIAGLVGVGVALLTIAIIRTKRVLRKAA